MEADSMRECLKKLALWNTRTFNPIMTHDELDPIMATLGFLSLPPSPSDSTTTIWKEYVYLPKSFQSASPCPPCRLPYPRIDGLHGYTYRAFLDAIDFYLNMPHSSDLFHIRGMPLHRGHDRDMKWRKMEEDENMLVYREGTIDEKTLHFYHMEKESNTSMAFIGSRSENSYLSIMVSLKDIIT